MGLIRAPRSCVIEEPDGAEGDFRDFDVSLALPKSSAQRTGAFCPAGQLAAADGVRGPS